MIAAPEIFCAAVVFAGSTKSGTPILVRTTTSDLYTRERLGVGQLLEEHAVGNLFVA